MMHGRKNKENCALKLIDEIICVICLRCDLIIRVWILRDSHNISFTGAAR